MIPPGRKTPTWGRPRPDAQTAHWFVQPEFESACGKATRESGLWTVGGATRCQVCAEAAKRAHQ